MLWAGGRKQLQKIKINRWATVGKGLIRSLYGVRGNSRKKSKKIDSQQKVEETERTIKN
jgi:hypothetical protein